MTRGLRLVQLGLTNVKEINVDEFTGEMWKGPRWRSITGPFYGTHLMTAGACVSGRCAVPRHFLKNQTNYSHKINPPENRNRHCQQIVKHKIICATFQLPLCVGLFLKKIRFQD